MIFIILVEILLPLAFYIYFGYVYKIVKKKIYEKIKNTADNIISKMNKNDKYWNQ